MEVQSVFSEKGAKLLVLNNYKFSKAHIAKCGKIRWRCTNTKSRCNAKIYTSADEKLFWNHNLIITMNVRRPLLGKLLVIALKEKLSRIVQKDHRN